MTSPGRVGLLVLSSLCRRVMLPRWKTCPLLLNCPTFLTTEVRPSVLEQTTRFGNSPCRAESAVLPVTQVDEKISVVLPLRRLVTLALSCPRQIAAFETPCALFDFVFAVLSVLRTVVSMVGRRFTFRQLPLYYMATLALDLLGCA